MIGSRRVRPLLSALALTAAVSAAAQPPSAAPNETSLSALIGLALERSRDRSAAEAELRFQKAAETTIDRSRLIPQINALAGYQNLAYDRLRENSPGVFGPNNGVNRIYGVTVSYDLQNLLGPGSTLARQASRVAALQVEVVRRDIVRNVKKAYFAIAETQSEIDELNKLVGLFDRIDAILNKQRKLGVYNELERRQFQLQKGVLYADLQVKRADLEGAYAQLAVIVQVDAETLKQRLAGAQGNPPTVFAPATAQDVQALYQAQDSEILDYLGGSNQLAKMQYSKFASLPYPGVYARGTRQLPTVPNLDGPNTTTEAGVFLPIDGFFTRPAQKEQLRRNSEKTQALCEKAFFEYRTQILLNATNLLKFRSQSRFLAQTRSETRELLEKSFLFYAQKRIDVLGELDLFQKYLQVARSDLQNDLRIRWADAELEYLVGGRRQ